MGKYRTVSNLPFLDKKIEQVVASQLQQFLRDTDCPDPVQSGLRPSYSAETALVTLMDDLRRDINSGSGPMLVLSSPRYRSWHPSVVSGGLGTGW